MVAEEKVDPHKPLPRSKSDDDPRDFGLEGDYPPAPFGDDDLPPQAVDDSDGAPGLAGLGRCGHGQQGRHAKSQDIPRRHHGPLHVQPKTTCPKNSGRWKSGAGVSTRLPAPEWG